MASKFYEKHGQIVFVDKVESVGSNGFTKRTFVVSTEPESDRPDCSAFVLKKDRTSLVTEKDVGRIVTVTFAPESRRWDDPKTGKVRWFTDLTAIKVNLESEQLAPEPAEPDHDDSPEQSSLDEMPF